MNEELADKIVFFIYGLGGTILCILSMIEPRLTGIGIGALLFATMQLVNIRFKEIKG